MASIREKLSERVKQRIAACQVEVRELLYGEAGCPVWGPRFAEIERTAMSVGEELSRQFMALAAEAQRREMPEEALSFLPSLSWNQFLLYRCSWSSSIKRGSLQGQRALWGL